MSRDEDYLRDILDAIARIGKYAVRGREEFERDELLQVWMIHHLQVIGEACAQISEGLRDAHPEVPWRQIVAMRHVLVHRYFRVDLNEVWVTVERDVPDLEVKTRGIIQTLVPST